MGLYNLNIKGNYFPIVMGDNSLTTYYTKNADADWVGTYFAVASTASNPYSLSGDGSSANPYRSSSIVSPNVQQSNAQNFSKNVPCIGVSGFKTVNKDIVTNIGDDDGTPNNVGASVSVIGAFVTYATYPGSTEYFISVWGQALAGIDNKRVQDVDGTVHWQVRDVSQVGPVKYLQSNYNPDSSDLQSKWGTTEHTFSQSLLTSTGKINIYFHCGYNSGGSTTLFSDTYEILAWTDIAGVRSITTKVAFKLDTYNGSDIVIKLVSGSSPFYVSKYFALGIYSSSSSSTTFSHLPMYGVLQ